MVLRGEIMKCSWLQNKVNKIVSCKTRNQQQTSQITDEPVKPPTNQSQTSQTIHKPPKNQSNHSQTSQISDKPPKNPLLLKFMLPKTLITMQNMC